MASSEEVAEPVSRSRCCRGLLYVFAPYRKSASDGNRGWDFLSVRGLPRMTRSVSVLFSNFWYHRFFSGKGHTMAVRAVRH